MYPIGVLFGLGFDTATEVALLVLAGGAAGAGLPWYAILCLPVLFAAGMSLMDTIDGSFMNFAYGWAFSKPVRKVFYNLAITGLSVAVAVVIGTIELGGLIAAKLSLSGSFWNWFENIDINIARVGDRRDVRRHVGDRAVGVALRADRGALERLDRPALASRGAYRHQGRLRIFATAAAGRTRSSRCSAEVIEVLAQPHAVVRARRAVDDARRGQRWRLELGHGPVIRRADLLGELVVPGRERRGTALEHGACLLEAGRVSRHLRHGVRGEAEPERPADEAPEVLLGDVLGPLLGEEPAQALVEAESGGPRGVAGVGLVGPRARSPTAPPGSGTRRPYGTRRRGRRRRPTATPRGQNSVPITTLTAQPSATSSIRTTPTFHPTGTIRLNRTAIITVNAA